MRVYRHTTGDQLPSAQQQPETAEFEHGIACCPARADIFVRHLALPMHGMRGAAVRRRHGPSVWFLAATWRFI